MTSVGKAGFFEAQKDFTESFSPRHSRPQVLFLQKTSVGIKEPPFINTEKPVV